MYRYNSYARRKQRIPSVVASVLLLLVSLALIGLYFVTDSAIYATAKDMAGSAEGVFAFVTVVMFFFAIAVAAHIALTVFGIINSVISFRLARLCDGGKRGWGLFSGVVSILALIADAVGIVILVWAVNIA